MADLHTELVNASMALDDIEKIEFKAELLNDPTRAQQYTADRNAKVLSETTDIKRAAFQKGVYDMGRYMDMDHHARYYDTRNTDLNNAQQNIIQIVNANTSSMKFDTDNTRRQFLVNEYYAQNKLESLFFLQVAFLAMVTSLVVIMMGKMGFLPWLFGKYIVFIIAAAAAILALYRFNYTKYTRDVRYWNKRKFSDSPGALKAADLCATATAAADSGAGPTTTAQYTTPSMPPASGPPR
jgi:hypothetical protein